ncbi:MAG: hypothetical protein ACI9DC_005286 [Gammaproteobacteria bacterium]|jgi:hypothetical protein
MLADGALSNVSPTLVEWALFALCTVVSAFALLRFHDVIDAARYTSAINEMCG